MSPTKKANNAGRNAGNGLLKIIGSAIVILAVVAMVFSSFLSGGGNTADLYHFGTYGDKKIEFRTDNEFGSLVNQSNVSTSNVDPENPLYDIQRYQNWLQAYRIVAIKKGMYFHVEDSGYEVSPRAIDRYIINSGNWNTNGVFDEELYQGTSSAVKEAMRSQYREEIAVSTWNQDVLQAKLRSDAQVEFLETMSNERKIYDLISIPFTDYPEEDVIAYGEENAELFQKVSLSQIRVDDQETADEVYALYEEQKSNIAAFADLAMEYSQDNYASSGGSIGERTLYSLSELIGIENSETVFATAEGSVAGPFETSYGWMMFQVDSAVETADITAVAADVRSYMRRNEVGTIEDALIARADEIRVNALARESFSEAAADAGYEVQTTPAFPINYGGDQILEVDPSNLGIAALSGATNSDAFWSELAPLKKPGQVSRPIVMSDSIVLLSLVEESIEETDVELASSYINAVANYYHSTDDFSAAVYNDENPLFDDNFTETYTNLFRGQS